MSPVLSRCEWCGLVKLCRQFQSGAFCQNCVEELEHRALESAAKRKKAT